MFRKLSQIVADLLTQEEQVLASLPDDLRLYVLSQRLSEHNNIQHNLW